MIILRTMDSVAAKIENGLIIVSVSLMTILTFVQIVLRSLYTYAHLQWANNALGYLDWTEPLSRLLVLWITFLGASLLTRDRKHIKIDILPSILPSSFLQIRDIVISVSAVLILVYMVIASIDLIKVEIEFGTSLFPGFPIWIGQLIIPVGFVLILFRFLLRIMAPLTDILRRPKA